MKNVLILFFPLESTFGGGERHTLRLVEHLSKRGYVFYLASSCRVLLEKFHERRWPSQKTWSPPEPTSKWSLFLFPWLFIPGWFWLTLVLFRYRFGRGVKTVYCLSLTEKILITPIARLLNMRVVWMEHVGFHPWLTRSPLRFLYRWWSGLAKIVVISEALKKQLRELGLPENRISVIYYGFDFGEIGLGDKPAPPLHRVQYVVGSVCRLEQEKGLEYLIIALAKVRPMIPNLTLRLVGEGSDRKRLEWLAKNQGVHDITQFVGYQSNPREWMKDFDVLVLPSIRRESFGAVLIEALAIERPVIASRLEGIPEIVHDGQTGLLTTPGRSDEIAQALITLYQDPQLARQLARNGRLFAEESFPVEKMIDQFSHIL
ncbi:MAG: glycosyltransferase family 4 protein [bacterium]|nr:glycosyltransferase family 4 protein [bacterium]